MLKKRSVNLHGHATSITMEDEFWNCLKDIAKERGISLNSLIADIDESHNDGNLSSALRVYVLKNIKKSES